MRSNPSEGDIRLPFTDLYLFHELFERRAHLSPHKTAIDVDGDVATYGELLSAGLNLYDLLIVAGVKVGDRIALSCKASLLAVSSSLSIMRASCILVTISHICEDSKFYEQLSDCGASILITDRDIEPLTVLARSKVDKIIHIDVNNTLELIDLKPNTPLAHEHFSAGPVPNSDNLAAIFYSSGTTGTSKGILLSHRNMIAAYLSVAEYLNISESDVVLSFTAGFSSDYGFYNVMIPLISGAKAIVRTLAPDRMETLAHIITNGSVTALHVFPPAILCLLSSDLFPLLPTLRYISTSGDILSISNTNLLYSAYPDVRLFSNYGMTECKRISYLTSEQLKFRPGSVGKAIPGVRIFLFDEKGFPFDEPHKVGELGIVSDLVMQGYWNQPALTAAVLKKNYFGTQSVFFTGDLFEQDKEGYLYFVCRKNELFIRNNNVVNPRLIERKLLTLCSLAEVVVLPISSNSQGLVPCACIVLRTGYDITEEYLKEFCTRQLNHWEIPAIFLFKKSLPRTFGGKVSRNDLASDLIGIRIP